MGLDSVTAFEDAGMEGLLTAQNEAEFLQRLASVARELGFEYCAYGMRMPLPLSNRKLFMLNNYSEEWQQRYAQENYLAVDPTVAHGMKSVAPVVWSESLFEGCPGMWEDARAHGLKVGWAQSSYAPTGAAGLLTLARSHDALTSAELRRNASQLAWFVQSAHEGMARLVAAKSPQMQTTPLTSREIEVLAWTADGKTSSEVGQIMNITERTVNFHVNNSLEKLGVVNKTACVVKAVMLGLL